MALHAVTASAAALPLPAILRRTRHTQTGGPDDGGEDEQLRWLMPILAAVILLAALFG